jgi:hypothetical protein
MKIFQVLKPQGPHSVTPPLGWHSSISWFLGNFEGNAVMSFISRRPKIALGLPDSEALSWTRRAQMRHQHEKVPPSLPTCLLRAPSRSNLNSFIFSSLFRCHLQFMHSLHELIQSLRSDVRLEGGGEGQQGSLRSFPFRCLQSADSFSTCVVDHQRGFNPTCFGWRILQSCWQSY